MARENGLSTYVHTHTHTHTAEQIHSVEHILLCVRSSTFLWNHGVWFVTLETVGPVHSLVTQLLYTHAHTQGISRINWS